MNIHERVNKKFNEFDRDFKRKSRVIWIMIGVVLAMILVIWATMGVGIYTVITDPESVGNIAADMIRPVADAIKEE